MDERKLALFVRNIDTARFSKLLRFVPNAHFFVFCDESIAQTSQVTPIQCNGRPWRDLANEVANSLQSFDTLFLLDGTLIPRKGNLYALQQELEDENVLAISPQLVRQDREDTARFRLAHYGIVFDSLLCMHSLYEGFLADRNCVTQRRAFQIAHDRALLLRCADFLAVGGYGRVQPGLEGFDLCLRLAAFRGGVFITNPALQFISTDLLQNFRDFGLWNSYSQRGQLIFSNQNKLNIEKL